MWWPPGVGVAAILQLVAPVEGGQARLHYGRMGALEMRHPVERSVIELCCVDILIVAAAGTAHAVLFVAHNMGWSHPTIMVDFGW